jgi:uncharacterized protein YaaQ
MMKLLIVILRDSDSEQATETLVKNNYRVTRMSSSGGFLRRGNTTLLVGVEENQVQPVLDLIQQACHPADSENQHRVTAFVVNLSGYRQI